MFVAVITLPLSNLDGIFFALRILISKKSFFEGNYLVLIHKSSKLLSLLTYFSFIR